MFGHHLIRNSLQYLMSKAPNQRWASGIAAANQLEAKHLQETALAENCILVDEYDRSIGQSSKRDCHRVDENRRIKLHRAFSVFLFNSNGDMLIQKRSSHKVSTISNWFYQLIVMGKQVMIHFCSGLDHFPRLLYKRLLQSSIV